METHAYYVHFHSTLHQWTDIIGCSMDILMLTVLDLFLEVDSLWYYVLWLQFTGSCCLPFPICIVSRADIIKEDPVYFISLCLHLHLDCLITITITHWAVQILGTLAAQHRLSNFQSCVFLEKCNFTLPEWKLDLTISFKNSMTYLEMILIMKSSEGGCAKVIKVSDL